MKQETTADKNEKQVITSALEKLKAAFQQVEEIHEDLLDLITDDEEFSEAGKYIETCQREFTQGLQIGTKYQQNAKRKNKLTYQNKQQIE